MKFFTPPVGGIGTIGEGMEELEVPLYISISWAIILFSSLIVIIGIFLIFNVITKSKNVIGLET
jgi:hypothetical protein